jgi:hypothetical protein
MQNYEWNAQKPRDIDLFWFYRELSTDRYHRLSDELLDFICGKLEELADETDMPGFDVEYNVSLVSYIVK